MSPVRRTNAPYKSFALFSQFPTDIQRLIFEEAFEESRRKATHFALVSHDVKSWIEPLIYQCIDLNRYTYSKSQRRQFRLFASTFHEGSKPKDFYTRYVQRIFVDDLQKWNLAEEFLPLCTNLISLACWAQPSPTTQTILESILSPHTLTLPRLRRLSLYWESLPPQHRSFHLPFFRNLTHLDIDFGPTVAWDGFSSLENLTYFNLDCIQTCLQLKSIHATAVHLQSIIQITLPHIPPGLRCFVILVPSTAIEHFVIDVEESEVAHQIYTELMLGEYDERIILGSSKGIPEPLLSYSEARPDFVHYIVPVPYDFCAWTYLPRGQKDFWMEAEDIISTRKRDLKSQSRERA